MELLTYIISFFLFALLQALFCNGIFECFKGSTVDGKPEGMLFYMMAPKFFERIRGKMWAKVFYCVRCVSGWAGTLTYWSIILPVFGFLWIEVIIWIFDIGILISLNYWVYKQL